MAIEHQPGIGNWYQTTTGDSFEIVACDFEDETIELQYYDGTLEELDMDIWSDLVIEPIEPPEDWSGSLDIQREDYGVDLDSGTPNRVRNPADMLDIEH